MVMTNSAVLLLFYIGFVLIINDAMALGPCLANPFTAAPNATDCVNIRDTTSCAALFPPGANPLGRPMGCLNSELKPRNEFSLECANHCRICCLTPAFTCGDNLASPINCTANYRYCKDPNWTAIMQTYCPGTCGMCMNATCRDVLLGCSDMRTLCNDLNFNTYMTANCQRTCNFCTATAPSTTSSSTSTCADVAINCVENFGLCFNSMYFTLMSQKCQQTCGRCSSNAVSTISNTFGCADLAINCSQNFGLCFNSLYYNLMSQKCQRTCGRCSSNAASSCVNANENCDAWVSSGFCTNPFYTATQRRQYCARSCGLC